MTAQGAPQEGSGTIGTQLATKLVMEQTSRQAKKASRQAHQQRMEVLHAEAREHVRRGTCPDCGAPLLRNLALAGWWQCAGYAAPSHRRPEYADLPKCSFQTFTQQEA